MTSTSETGKNDVAQVQRADATVEWEPRQTDPFGLEPADPDRDFSGSAGAGDSRWLGVVPISRRPILSELTGTIRCISRVKEEPGPDPTSSGSLCGRRTAGSTKFATGSNLAVHRVRRRADDAGIQLEELLLQKVTSQGWSTSIKDALNGLVRRRVEEIAIERANRDVLPPTSHQPTQTIRQYTDSPSPCSQTMKQIYKEEEFEIP